MKFRYEVVHDGTVLYSIYSVRVDYEYEGRRCVAWFYGSSLVPAPTNPHELPEHVLEIAAETYSDFKRRTLDALPLELRAYRREDRG